MNTHRMLRAAVLGALWWLCALAAPAQQTDFSKVEIKPEKLTDNLYVLFGYGGGNMALLTGPDGPLLVDDQFAELSPKIRAAVSLLTDKPVRFIVNTHCHLDHTGGNAPFGRAGAVIIAHDNTRKRLSSEQFIALFKLTVPAAPAEALPLVTFEDGLTLHLNGEDIEAVHVPPAHTDSDVVLYFTKANVVHTGDVFIAGYPIIDDSSGGTYDGIVGASEQILARTRADTRIIPGHGPVSTRADLQAYHDMLVTVRTRVLDQIRKGRTQEQVLAAAPTKEFDAKYGQMYMKPELWLQRVYVELKRSLEQRQRKVK
jgi:cyclase